jgi:tRNA(fMet)-specific endonuclease VapC
MTGLDADVLTLLAAGNPATRQRASAAPPNSLALPVVVAEQVLRGRLATVRQAQAGKGRFTLPQAYDLFAGAVRAVAAYPLLPYTPQADPLFRQWAAAKLRVGVDDLRIGAICVAHGATLATRNARDFTQVPGLTLDIWP